MAADQQAQSGQGRRAGDPGRLHIAFVVPGFVLDRDDPGMPAVVDLVERVAAVHDCDVVALRYPPAPRPYRVAGARVRSLGPARFGGVLGRAAVLSRGVRAVVAIDRRHRIDVIHGLWADEPGAVAAIAGRLLRRPVVVSVMGGELARLPDIGYGAALGRGGRWTTAIALRDADLVTAGSRQAVASVARRGLAAPRLLLAPLGVDVATFHPEGGTPTGSRATDAAKMADAVPETPKTTVLFVGSLEPVKDPASALGVFANLAADRPRLRLEIVGDGRLRDGLTGLAEALGIRDRVRFLGQLPRSEMPGRYRGASILLVTSRHEGQSMVAVEAAACGTPVVGTRVGILPDLGSAAITVRVGDEGGLARAAARVIDDPALAATMGAAGRAAAVARYALDRTVRDAMENYAAVVSSGFGPSSGR